MKIEYMNRDQYEIGYFSVGDKSQSAVFVIGSVVYYPRIFEDNVFKKMHLIFMDHRGFVEPKTGEEKNLPGLLDAVVEDIEAIRQRLGLEKVYVLGHSGHGFMAMAYADKYPEHVLGVILSNLAPTNTEERNNLSFEFFNKDATAERKEQFFSEIIHLESDIEKDPANKFTHLNVRTQAQSFYDYTFDNRPLWVDVYNNVPALDYLWGIAFAEYETEAFIRATHLPLLLLQSRYDYLIAPMNLWDEMIAKYAIQTFVFEKSGHNPMLEEPEAYKEQLAAFIK